jgi:hypothetical protein
MAAAMVLLREMISGEDRRFIESIDSPRPILSVASEGRCLCDRRMAAQRVPEFRALQAAHQAFCPEGAKSSSDYPYCPVAL